MTGSNTHERHIERLASVLTQSYPDLKPVTPLAWKPPHRILDVALSVDSESDRVCLSRSRYRRAVVRPIETFRASHPDLATLADLHTLVAEAPTPQNFAREVLGVDAWRGPVVLALLDHLRAKVETWQDVLAGATEQERLADLMSEAFTGGSEDVEVASDYVGEGTYRYLRMQLGAPVVVKTAAVYDFVGEVLGSEAGDVAELLGEAIQRVSLTPLAVLWALQEDRAQGRVWGAAPGRLPSVPGMATWVPYFERLIEMIDLDAHAHAVRDGIGLLHQDLPLHAVGTKAARSGDSLAAANALLRLNRSSSYGAIATRLLIALHMVAIGYSMDAEAEYAVAHGLVYAMIVDLKGGDERVNPELMRCLRTLLDLTGMRIQSWHRRSV